MGRTKKQLVIERFVDRLVRKDDVKNPFDPEPAEKPSDVMVETHGHGSLTERLKLEQELEENKEHLEKLEVILKDVESRLATITEVRVAKVPDSLTEDVENLTDQLAGEKKKLSNLQARKTTNLSICDGMKVKIDGLQEKFKSADSDDDRLKYKQEQAFVKDEKEELEKRNEELDLTIKAQESFINIVQNSLSAAKLRANEYSKRAFMTGNLQSKEQKQDDLKQEKAVVKRQIEDISKRISRAKVKLSELKS